MIEIVNALAHKYNNSAILYFEQKKRIEMKTEKKNSEREMNVINFNERVRWHQEKNQLKTKPIITIMENNKNPFW